MNLSHLDLPLGTTRAFSLILLSLVSAGAAEPTGVPIEDLGTKSQLLGKLHEPLGQFLTIRGIAVNGADKGYETGRTLRIQQVNDRATQEDIRLCINPYFGKWNQYLPKIPLGNTYEMYGYETGGYAGHLDFPDPASLPFPPIQDTAWHFSTNFVVLRAKPISPLRYSPADFQDRKALMEGTARTVANEALVQGDAWSISVDLEKGSPPEVEGKQVETEGFYAPDEQRKIYKLVDGTWRLIRLEDQIGRSVDLHGRSFNSNSGWGIHYRGVDLYVENLTELHGWSYEKISQPIEIRGILEKAKLPSPNDRAIKPGPVDCYIVRRASLVYLPALRFPELPLEENEIDPARAKDLEISDTENPPPPATPAPRRPKPKKTK
jgi:hypothetical protein